MTTLRIESLNCRGIRDKLKQTDVLDRACSRKVNILCLQETHLIGKDLYCLKADWNVKYLISGNQRNARGVMIIFDNNFNYYIHNVMLDQEGRYILVEIVIPQVASFLLCNVYCPNDEKMKFCKKIFILVDTSDLSNVIMVGEWNTIL